MLIFPLAYTTVYTVHHTVVLVYLVPVKYTSSSGSIRCISSVVLSRTPVQSAPVGSNGAQPSVSSFSSEILV